MSVNDYTLDDAHNHGFDLLELYRLWHWNSCFPFAERHDEIDERIDAIKREIEERYVLLPVDADGVPIHIGDKMVCMSGIYEGIHATVWRIAYGEENGHVYEWMDGNHSWHTCENWRHDRTPTVEDLLWEMLKKSVGFSDAHTAVALNAVVEYAGKIRKLMADE